MIGQEATAHRVLDRLRLLVDFFEHKMVVSAFFNGFEVEFELLYKRTHLLITAYFNHFQRFVEVNGSHFAIF